MVTVNVSLIPGSVKLPLTVTVSWSAGDDGETATAASDGATLVTTTVVVPETDLPPLSVTVTDAVNEPLSTYVCLASTEVWPARSESVSDDPSPQLTNTLCVSATSTSLNVTPSVALPPSATALGLRTRLVGSWLLGSTTRSIVVVAVPLSRSATVTRMVTVPGLAYA